MNFRKNYKHFIIALILFFCVKLFVPTANGLTEVGVSVLAVLLPILYLWLTVGTDWVSLLALAAVIMTGVLSATDTYAASMGSSTVIIVITCMALNKVLSDTGVIRKIAHWFLTRDIVRNRPTPLWRCFFWPPHCWVWCWNVLPWELFLSPSLLKSAMKSATKKANLFIPL